VIKSKIRRSKSEARKKSELRNLKVSISKLCLELLFALKTKLDFPPSAFGLLSEFGDRISRLGLKVGGLPPVA
jgi:hypothetical protein